MVKIKKRKNKEKEQKMLVDSSGKYNFFLILKKKNNILSLFPPKKPSTSVWGQTEKSVFFFDKFPFFFFIFQLIDTKNVKKAYFN